MNNNDYEKKLKEEIDYIEDKISSLEYDKRVLERERKDAQAVYDIGLATLAVDPIVGLASQTISDREIRELDYKISDIKEQIKKLEAEFESKTKEYSQLQSDNQKGTR